jgi:GxxExxY protein
VEKVIMGQQGGPVRDRETHAVIGAALEVHRVLGCGFLEAVYQAALAEELRKRGISFAEQVELPIAYKGLLLRTTYRADFVVSTNIVVELKALDELTGRERAQLINYLRAAELGRGLLINFGAQSLQYEHLVWNYSGSMQAGAQR